MDETRLADVERRTAWLRDGRFGIMVHWLSSTQPRTGVSIKDWNRKVDSFRLDDFWRQFKFTGADYLIFTLGQNTGFYCSPNKVLDRFIPDRCSRRDLAGEIAERLKKSDKHFLAYLPSEVDISDEALRTALGWEMGGNRKQTFQKRYMDVIQEWARSLDDRLSGWWFDGCYDQHPWMRTEDWDNSRFDYPLWVKAARSGNSDALVTFNNGVGSFLPICAQQDYTAGEMNELTHLPSEPITFYMQWHALTFLDCFWIHAEKPGEIAPPRFSDDELFTYVRKCRINGGAVTLNVGIYEDGTMSETTVEQLRRLSVFLSKEP